MRRISRVILWFAVLAIALPVAAGALLGSARGWPQNWKEADWGSSGLLVDASRAPEAQVLILAARTGRWKSIFAEHMWIVVKPAGAAAWRRYDVVGWGKPVRRDNWPADAFWYGNMPRVVARVSGAEAAALIPRVERAIKTYPYGAAGDYTVWPGPNSNSFVGWVVRQVPGLETELPAVAVGKDYLGPGLAFANAPSGTGWEASFDGLIGFTLAAEEGFELHLLGSTIGIDPNDAAIKLPALGKLSLFDLWG